MVDAFIADGILADFIAGVSTSVFIPLTIISVDLSVLFIVISVIVPFGAVTIVFWQVLETFSNCSFQSPICISFWSSDIVTLNGDICLVESAVAVFIGVRTKRDEIKKTKIIEEIIIWFFFIS